MKSRRVAPSLGEAHRDKYREIETVNDRGGMPNFETLLESIAKRPAMYVGTYSLRAVSNYLGGYDHAWGDLCQSETPLSGWGHWVYLRFLIFHPAWHWTRVLLHAYGSDQAAFESLPTLYKEFLAQRALLGVQGIEDELNRRLIEVYGRDWHEPLTTSTTVDY